MGQGLAPCPSASKGLVEGIPPQLRLLQGPPGKSKVLGIGMGTGALHLPEGSESPAALPARRQEEAIPAAGPLLLSRCVLP